MKFGWLDVEETSQALKSARGSASPDVEILPASRILLRRLHERQRCGVSGPRRAMTGLTFGAPKVVGC